jgi:hypothetical protein
MAERHIHLVLDDIDLGALAADDLPIPPALLPCAVCRQPRSAHGPWSACPLFERPAPPAGHSYVDELEVGTPFRFLDAGRASCRHVLARRGPTGRFAPGLIQVEATGQACGATAYLLHEATIVRLEERPDHP